MRITVLLSLLVGCGSPSPTPAVGESPAAANEAPVAESPAAANGAPVGCAEAYDITFSPGTTFEDVSADAASPFPSGVTFSAAVERAGDTVRIEGTLLNTTGASVNVDYLTGGVMGISTNPFQVDIDVQPRTATGPEIYPAPRRVVLPPHGSLTYRVERCPTFPARVRWTFTPWRGDAVQGDVVVR